MPLNTEKDQDFNGDISEKSDNNSNSSKRSSNYKNSPTHTQKDIVQDLPSEKTHITEQDKLEKLAIPLHTILEEASTKDNETKALKKVAKHQFANKLVKEVFKNILLNKLKKKKALLKLYQDVDSSPIHVKDFSLLNDSNSSFQKSFNRGVDKKVLKYFSNEPLVFLGIDAKSYGDSLWELIYLNVSSFMIN